MATEPTPAEAYEAVAEHTARRCREQGCPATSATRCCTDLACDAAAEDFAQLYGRHPDPVPGAPQEAPYLDPTTRRCSIPPHVRRACAAYHCGWLPATERPGDWMAWERQLDALVRTAHRVSQDVHPPTRATRRGGTLF